jgi:hypothetical protein
MRPVRHDSAKIFDDTINNQIDGAVYVARLSLFDKAAVLFRTGIDGDEHPASHS